MNVRSIIKTFNKLFFITKDRFEGLKSNALSWSSFICVLFPINVWTSLGRDLPPKNMWASPETKVGKWRKEGGETGNLTKSPPLRSLVNCRHFFLRINKTLIITSQTHMGCVYVCSVVSDSFATPWTPPRLLCPWDFPSKKTGVGCHFLLQGSSWPRDQTYVSCVSCTSRQNLSHYHHLRSMWRYLKLYVLRDKCI